MRDREGGDGGAYQRQSEEEWLPWQRGRHYRPVSECVPRCQTSLYTQYRQGKDELKKISLYINAGWKERM